LWVVDLAPIAGARGSEEASASTTGRAWSRFADWTSASDADLSVVVRALATLLGAGVPLHRALSYAAKEAATAPQRAAFSAVRDAVERGESLSAAVQAQSLFPPVFAPLIAAGEGSGTLDASLALLADHLERRDTLRNRLRSALIYPSILAVASIVGVVVILLVVVPRFAELITDAGGRLPASTRALIAVSGVLTHGWWLVLGVIAVTALALSQWLRDPVSRRRMDESRLAWPLVGRLEHTQAAAGYTGTLAIGLRAGVSLLGAMALARAVVRKPSLGGIAR
jgi:type II secretory pathway component PulF